MVVMATGVGGAGKTSVLKELKEVLRERIAIAPSFTREGYAAAAGIGIRVQTQEQALALPAERYGLLQDFLQEHFLKQATAFIREHAKNPQIEAVVFERSPFCYAAYTQALVLPGYYHGPTIKRRIRSFLHTWNPWIAYFPGNPPWARGKAEALKDGFRLVDEDTKRKVDTELICLLCGERWLKTLYMVDYDLNPRVRSFVHLIETNPENPSDYIATQAPGTLDSSNRAKPAADNLPDVGLGNGAKGPGKVRRVPRAKP